MAGHSAHPVDAHKNIVNVKDGTNALHVCPHPASLGASAAPRRNVTKSVLAFDSDKLHHLFHSAAYSIAMARNTKLSPMRATDKDSWGVRFFSAVLPDSLHTKEVELPEMKQLQKEAGGGANQFGELFWTELHERGIYGAIVFLRDVEAQRQNAIEATRQVYREAAMYNQGAESRQQNFYHGLVAVKCASTIIVAALSLPLVPGAAAAAGWATAGSVSGLTSFGIGTAYSISLTLIKDWDKADSADLVVVARDKAVTKTEQRAVRQGAQFAQKIAENESQLGQEGEKILLGKHWLQKRLAAGGDTPEKMLQYARKLKDAKAGVRAAQNAYRLSAALKTVPYLLFAWSAKDALKTAYDEW